MLASLLLASNVLCPPRPPMSPLPNGTEHQVVGCVRPPVPPVIRIDRTDALRHRVHRRNTLPLPPATTTTWCIPKPNVRCAPPSLSFFHHGLSLPYHEPVQRLFSNQQQWDQFWQSAGTTTGFSLPAGSTGVVISSGYKPTGGYSIDIDTVTQIGPNQLQVEVTETSPGPSCFVTLATTHPYVAFAIPSPTPIAQLHIVRRHQTFNCQ